MFLDVSQVEAIHEESIILYGGPNGTRDRNLLESAVQAPQLLYLYDEGNSDIFDWAARLCSRICMNHPFVDGNKRTGFFSAVAFLRANGITFSHGETDLTDDVVAQIVIAHIEKRIAEDQLSLCLFIFANRHILHSVTQGIPGMEDKEFDSAQEYNAYCTDHFLTEVNARLIGFCQQHHVRPDRLKEFSEPSAQMLIDKIDPHHQRVFGWRSEGSFGSEV